MFVLYRPPTLLSKDQLKDVKKNLKKYSVQFDQKDRLRLSRASKELVEKRRQAMAEFEVHSRNSSSSSSSNSSSFLTLF